MIALIESVVKDTSEKGEREFSDCRERGVKRAICIPAQRADKKERREREK